MTALSGWLDRSLGRRIAVMVCLLLALTGGALVLGFYLQVRRVNERNTAERLRLLAGQMSEMLGRGPAASVTALSKIAADPDVIRLATTGGEGGAAPPPASLAGQLSGQTRRAIAVLDSDGHRLAVQGSDSQPGWFGPDPEGLRERRADAGPEVLPFALEGDSTLYYDVRVPIRSGDRSVGLVVERYQISNSQAARAALANLLGDSTSLVIGAPSSGIWSDLAGPTPAPPLEAMRTGALNRFKADSVAYLGYAAPVANTSWTLVVRSPESVVMAPTRNFLKTAIVFAILAMLLGGAGAILLARRLNRPLADITNATERMAAGDYSHHADEASPGEIGRLARSFNAMIDRVGESTRQLSASEASHRAFVAHASQGIWRLEFPEGMDTRLSPVDQIRSWYAAAPMAECNPILAQMCGLASGYDLIQIPLARLFPPDDLRSTQVLETFIARGHRCSGVESHEQRNGDAPRIFTDDLIGIVERGQLKCIWGTRRDVTLERSIDERIAQSQRLESVGRLAGGIAHDFNNLLTVILADTEAIQEQLGSDNRELAEIDAAARRAADLTRQLLAFSRGQVRRPRVLDLNSVVTSFETMLRRVIGEDIDLRLRLGEHLEPVEADPGQIERVVMNLVVNARDAMPRGGTLELRTERVDLDEEYARQRPGVRAGRHVLLAVSDTGTGMTEEVRRQAFEPFFTTKAKGRGTGLGLASVYGVVRQSGGDISIYSEPGHGTTVKIYLPAVGEGVPAAAEVRGARITDHGPGEGTVLLVEDDPAVRKLVLRSLGGLGFEVIEAADGEAALRAGALVEGRVDLVLTDMVMPGMSGVELVAELRAHWPTLAVVVMSGYTGDTYVDPASLPSDVRFLEKPFSVADLQRVVSEAIAARRR